MAKKRYTLSDIKSYVPKTLEFDGEFQALVGQPELKGSWIVWGNSGNGKTSFALQLAMYFTQFCKVVYDSIEEGMSKSMQDALARIPVGDKSKYRFSLLDRVGLDELKSMLRKKRAADVIFIDSIQYTGMSYADYKSLLEEFPKKMFVFVSHADGQLPKGEVAKSVRYDAMVKIQVKSFVATAIGRYGGGKPFVISKRKSEEMGYNVN
ncbi:MAG: ATP-binding protein [Paludibacteraceae bacterium]|nr:ATP-binding protein [Paludibacteraceae bacterium]